MPLDRLRVPLLWDLAEDDIPGMAFPALWECKTMNDKSWRDTVKHGVSKSKPVYAAQMAIYQAYMEASIPGISANPAVGGN